MAMLFGVNKSGISRHINNILDEGELQRDVTVAKNATVVNRNYDCTSPTAKEFYAMVQNRFHYAITGQTAAEIIVPTTRKNTWD